MISRPLLTSPQLTQATGICYSLLPETQGPGPVTGSPGPDAHCAWTARIPDPRRQSGDWGKSGCHLLGLCGRAQGASFHHSCPCLAKRTGTPWTACLPPPRPNRSCHTWVSVTGPLFNPLQGQGTPLAASQTLSLGGAFFPDKGPVWASLRDLCEPPVGECEGEEGFFKCMYFDFL